MQNRKHQSGFTLVEILIVVVILGILAAIVIPQFTNASVAARESSVTAQLQSIRSQLELYQVQHNGNYPTLVQLWGNLTGQTDIDGAAGTDYGPYLQKAPVNPFENSSTVDIAANAASGVGWIYDASTGGIQVNLSAATAATTNIPAGDVVTY